jgi:hypothetical protein
MKSTRSRTKTVAAEQIAQLADGGQDISRFFTGSGRMMPAVQTPVQRVNVDFAAPMLNELDHAARELNISRQALIKSLVRQALDQHYVAHSAGLASMRAVEKSGGATRTARA